MYTDRQQNKLWYIYQHSLWHPLSGTAASEVRHINISLGGGRQPFRERQQTYDCTVHAHASKRSLRSFCAEFEETTVQAATDVLVETTQNLKKTSTRAWLYVGRLELVSRNGTLSIFYRRGIRLWVSVSALDL